MKIKIPQLLVNYLGGSGGEWLAIQMCQHDKYLSHWDYDVDLKGKKNEFNRWRIAPGWRSWLMSDSDYANDVWNDHNDYDNSEEWWAEYNKGDKKTAEYRKKIDEMLLVERTRIPVHRCHEAWQDVHLIDEFEEFKIVNIVVDYTDKVALRQFQGNVLKKIFWQDLSDPDDLEDEMRDKCRKFDVEWDDAKAITDKFSLPINYTDMMFALSFAQTKNTETAFRHTVENLGNRWDWDMLDQYKHDIKGVSYNVDFRRLFIDKNYDEYTALCEFVGCTPWSSDKWNQVLSDYVDPDMENIITLEELEDRLCLRITELQ